MKIYSKYINPYIDKILNNEIEHCKEQELMMKNIVIPVLNRDDIYFDEEKVEAGLSLQKYFPFNLLEWEIFLFALIAGVFFKSGDIFFSEVRAMLGRGSGKNGFISFLCFYFISPVHGIKGYNVDLLANAEKQAKTSFNDVYEIIKDPIEKSYKKVLSKHFKATKEEVKGLKTKSTLRFNTSSKRGKDSKRTGAVIFDEKHEYLDSTNMNTLMSGLGKVKDPRKITITTDGHVRGGVLDKEKEENRKILSAYDPDNRTLVFICKIDEEKEWNQEEKWIKAIPSINDFPYLKTEIKNEVRSMSNTPDYYKEFMAKRMNFPVGDKDIEVATWEDIMATNQEFIDLKGKDCVGGIDFAKSNDFIGCCLIFYENEKYYVLQHTFICAKSRDLLGIKAPLKDWASKGDCTFIDDVEIPPEIVVQWFDTMKQKYNIKKIAIDYFRFSLLNSCLKQIGFDAFELKNVKLVRPSDIMKVSVKINSIFVRHLYVWGDVPILRWATNNSKKIIQGNNITYGKQEPNYRKTDTFMALVNGMTVVDEIEKENTEISFMAPMVF
ncbi:MAG: terminase TerL endonuclease subunit [Intestinibacter bartlettii]|uniref:terminase TerL endonuclease subunit n=1 Tax=Intestinibacter bartlettii TaxID=261299 RepID=UPI0029009045|nr:terminase TerL endonuclease subunit [Intestinibacter bartlettii]MDU2692790.1 terminase TerL endonuclease subunit [Intestinibacter bartlettii]